MTIERRTVVIKRGTADEWAQHDDVLLEGELGALIQDGPDILKIGDGATPFSELPNLTADLSGVTALIDAKYTLPADGIPGTVFSADVQDAIAKANTAYQKPADGILIADLAVVIQASLSNANTAVQPSAVANSTIFAKGSTGVVFGVGYSTSGTASNAIPQRDAAGQLAVPATPTATTHATSKSYVDAQIATRVGNTRNVTAGTGLTGGGTLAADISFALDAATIASLGKADTATQPSVLATALAAKADLVGGLIPTSQIPALAITDVFPVTTQAAMLALTAQRGDVAIRSDVNATYILAAEPATTLANWVVLPTPAGGGGGAVTSVNSQTGVVVLGKADIGLGNVDNTSDLSKPVSTAQQAALDLKVNTAVLSSNGQALIRNGAGTLVGLSYSAAASANSMAQRNSTGDVTVNLTPTATTDATSKSYVDGRTPVTTRVASYTFGGCESTDTDWGGATTLTQRTRFRLTVQPTRYRIHVRNALKLTDAAASTTSLTGLAAWVGPQNTATNWDRSTAGQQAAAGSTSVVTGATEWVSGWTVPTVDLTKPSLIDLQYSMPVNTPLAVNNASHTIFITAGSKGGTTAAVGTPRNDGVNMATEWSDFYISMLEFWIEYEYADATVRQGLVIGHSFPDSASYLGSGPWDGQNSGWPQLTARQNNQAITVDAVANASTSTYAPTSPKWSLFATHTFDWVIVDLVGNDIQSGVANATAQANLLAIVAKIRALWPKARVFVANLMGNKPQDATVAHETARVAFNAWLNTPIGVTIDGILDYERAVGLLTDLTTIDPRMLDANATAGLRHLSNYGAAMVAQATTVR